MAISYVNSTIKCEQSTVAGTTQAGIAPTGVVAGDFLLICASASLGTLPVWSGTTFTGWTTQLSLSETAMITLFLWRIADGTSTDNPPTINTNAAAHRVTVVGAYRGVDNAAPLIASNGQVAAATQTVQAAPSITNTDAAAWAVYIGTARQVATPLTWSATSGNLVTAERQDADIALSNTNNTSGTLYDSNGVVATGAAVLSATTSATTPQSTVWGAFLKPAASGPTTITVADTGAGADAATVAATVPVADTGSGTDAVTVSVPIAATDTGTSADAVAVSVTVPVADTGAGADAATVTASVPVADTSTAADAATVSAGVPVTDTGSGADAVSVSVPVAISDTGAGSDAATVAAAVPLADPGSGTDTISALTAQVPAADTGSGADALAISASILVADTGGSADAISVSLSVPLTDTGSSTDTATVAATVPVADTAAGTDTLAITAAVPLADIGSGADALSVGGPPLSPPTGLTVTPVSDTEIDVSWVAAAGASGYDIERDGVVIVTAFSGTSYADTGLTHHTTYNYRVRSRA